MPAFGTTTAVPDTVMPWLARPDVFAPVIGSTAPVLPLLPGTRATPCDVNDGSVGVVTAAYETPPSAMNSATHATASAGVGRWEMSLRMVARAPGVGGAPR